MKKNEKPCGPFMATKSPPAPGLISVFKHFKALESPGWKVYLGAETLSLFKNSMANYRKDMTKTLKSFFFLLKFKTVLEQKKH